MPVSGVNLSSSADKTQAPASLVVHTETGGPFDATGSLSLRLVLVSAAQIACVRTRTSNAVSMRYDVFPAR